MNQENTPNDPLLIMAARLQIKETTVGASFSWSIRLIAVLIASACFYGAYANWHALLSAKLELHVWVLIAGAGAMICYTVYWICAAKTTVSPTMIEQSYIFNRRMHLGDLASAKFIYIPFLTWLIAPRVFLRSAGGKFTVIYGATPELHRKFGQLHRITHQNT